MRLILLVFSVFQKVTRHKGRESAFGCRGGTPQSLSTTGTQHSRTKGHTAVAMVDLCPDSASAVDSHWQEPSAGTYNARPINHSKSATCQGLAGDLAGHEPPPGESSSVSLSVKPVQSSSSWWLGGDASVCRGGCERELGGGEAVIVVMVMMLS